MIQTQAFGLEILRELHYRETPCDAAGLAKKGMVGSVSLGH